MIEHSKCSINGSCNCGHFKANTFNFLSSELAIYHASAPFNLFEFQFLRVK